MHHSASQKMVCITLLDEGTVLAPSFFFWGRGMSCDVIPCSVILFLGWCLAFHAQKSGMYPVND
jgi:hypothetical protein